MIEKLKIRKDTIQDQWKNFEAILGFCPKQ